MDQSAGGGSIVHQLTAVWGHSEGLFQRAIVQSPAIFPLPGNQQQETSFQNFLRLLNVTSLGEARQLPSDDLVKKTYQQIFNAPYGSYIYGPALDGALVPAPPRNLLQQRLFSRGIQVMSGYNAQEGVLFTDPRITDDISFGDYIRRQFPDMNNERVDFLLHGLYPPTYDGSQPYNSFLERLVHFVGEAYIKCNAEFVVTATTAHGPVRICGPTSISRV